MNGTRSLRNPLPAPAAQRGVVMIEVMVAILIFSVGVLAIVGLQATMIKSTADAKYRADANYIAQSRIGQIWADAANAASYVENATDISAMLPSGTRTVVQVSPRAVHRHRDLAAAGTQSGDPQFHDDGERHRGLTWCTRRANTPVFLLPASPWWN